MADAAPLLGAARPDGTLLGDDGSPGAILHAAAALADDGRVRDALTLLTDANRRRRSPQLEKALVELRRDGFERTDDPKVPPHRAGAAVDLDIADGIPAVAPSELSVDALRQGIDRFGCLLVRNLLSTTQVRHLVDGIDRTFEAFDAWQADPKADRDDEAAGWFTPFRPVPGHGERVLGGRLFTRRSGAVWAVESPRMLFELIEVFEQVGLGSLIASHLGERPALSAAKCNLRRTPVHIPGAWHQDGSFLGRDVPSIDVWVALSECGRDAPGLDIVPHRFEHLLETGLDSVVVDHETVLDAIEPLDVTVVSPEFHPGDVLLFDHLFLHRTAITPEMTQDRHALETWFFAPSHYPKAQIPLLY